MVTKNKEITIKVNIEDVEKLMNECKELYLRANPEMKEVYLSRKFMFSKVIKFYIEN